MFTVPSPATVPKFDCQKEYREYEKCMRLILTLNLRNLTTVARAKRVEPQGEMRWKLFGLSLIHI